MTHDTQSDQITQEQDGHNIYVIMMCPIAWVATEPLW